MPQGQHVIDYSNLHQVLLVTQVPHYIQHIINITIGAHGKAVLFNKAFALYITC